MTPKLINLAIRLVAGAVILVMLVFSSFQWGKNACRATYEAAIAKIQADHADTVALAQRQAAARAIEAKEKELENEQRLDDIVRAAADEPEAMDECISADVMRRLRELQ